MAQLERGTLVRFNHERDGGPVRRVASVAPDGMIELEDMGGFFAPHLFEIADDIADIPPRRSGYVDPEDILEGAQQRLMEQLTCECPKCGRLHHSLRIRGCNMIGPFAPDFLADCILEDASVRRIHPQDIRARLVYAQHELAFLAYREDQRTEWGATLRWFAQRRLSCTPAQCARIFHYMLTLERIIP